MRTLRTRSDSERAARALPPTLRAPGSGCLARRSVCPSLCMAGRRQLAVPGQLSYRQFLSHQAIHPHTHISPFGLEADRHSLCTG